MGGSITDYEIQYKNVIKFNGFMMGLIFFCISIQFVKLKAEA